MRNRAGQVDMAHALAAHLGQGDFGAALLADHATVLHALVLAAQALVVLGRPEDGGAEQAVTLGLEGAVVDRLGLLHLAEGPRADQVRRSQGDLDRVEIQRLALLVEEIEQVFHFLLRESGFEIRYASIRNSGGRGRLPPIPNPRVPVYGPHSSSNSMLMASERISFTRTLKDSGMPATI